MITPATIATALAAGSDSQKDQCALRTRIAIA